MSREWQPLQHVLVLQAVIAFGAQCGVSASAGRGNTLRPRSDHGQPEVVSVVPHGALTTENSSLRMPSFLSSHMVLQRGGATVWGWAAAGTHVTVTVRDELGAPITSATATASETGVGDWRVEVSLPARVNSSVTVAAPGEPTITLQDIAWGDVFLCSGQVRFFIVRTLFLRRRSTLP
jgi:hypothetical protein